MSEFFNFKENVTKIVLEKILEKQNIQAKIGSLQQVITLSEHNIKIINCQNLTFVGKQTLFIPGSSKTDLNQSSSYFVLKNVPHLSEVFEIFVLNSMVKLKIDGYDLIIFLNTNL